MIESGKPRKQRKFRYNAAMHIKQHFLHAHVSKELRSKLKTPRAIQISKGDTVRLMVGSKKGLTGKIARVSLRSGNVYIDSYTKKNARGKEYTVPVSVSNVYITDLNLSDKLRAARLKAPAPKS
jgi:large subunit ribosomal protein L24